MHIVYRKLYSILHVQMVQIWQVFAYFVTSVLVSQFELTDAAHGSNDEITQRGQGPPDEGKPGYTQIVCSGTYFTRREYPIRFDFPSISR